MSDEPTDPFGAAPAQPDELGDGRPTTRTRRLGRGAGLVAGGALVGAVIAGSVPAIAGSATPSPSGPGSHAADGDRPGGHARGDEKPLTGTTADKVRAAALAKVPGATVDRLETDADGAAYEAHLTKPDGTRVTVKLDKSFAVTSVRAGRFGGWGHGDGRAHGGERALTGATADKVRAAALAKVPGATVNRLETDSDGAAYEAHLTKADGTRVTVKLDGNFEVTAVETGGPGGHGFGGPPPQQG